MNDTVTLCVYCCPDDRIKDAHFRDDHGPCLICGVEAEDAAMAVIKTSELPNDKAQLCLKIMSETEMKQQTKDT